MRGGKRDFQGGGRTVLGCALIGTILGQAGLAGYWLP